MRRGAESLYGGLKMKVKVEFVVEDNIKDEDDRKEFLVKFEKRIISKKEIKYDYIKLNYWTYTILEEFEFNSMRDFIFDFEKEIETYEYENFDYEIKIESVTVKSIEYDWQARKYGWD